MKKTNKPNPLKVFNDNKAMAYKKAGGEMSKYKKSLKRFQGDVTGSQVSSADDSNFDLSIFNNRMYNTAPVMGKIQGVRQDVGLVVDPRANSKSVIKEPKNTKGIVAGQEMEFTPEQMESIFGIRKRGGSIGRKRK